MQQKLLNAILRGNNVLLHGPGGTGKSHTLREIATYLEKKSVMYASCATTGVAAVNLGIASSRTLHSWAGIGNGDRSVDSLIAKIRMRDEVVERWNNTDILIIDEVSMLGKELFEKLFVIGQILRKNESPFGGIQLICSGDFFQLPPVRDQWIFESSAWNELSLVPFRFTTGHRYDDKNYYQMLLRIRRGGHTSEDLKRLQKRVKAYDKYLAFVNSYDGPGELIKPTVMHSRKVDVAEYNLRELARLPSKEKTYKCIDTYKPFNPNFHKETMKKKLDENIPKRITLKVGAQVMLKCNLSVSGGLVNGTRGVVTKLCEESVYVKFIGKPKPIQIEYQTWENVDKNGKATRFQLPFVLAWAMTIHKSQGCTLDYVVCDVGYHVFADGQAYVALSRVRNLKGLFLSGYTPKAFRTNEDALEYVNSLFETEDDLSE